MIMSEGINALIWAIFINFTILFKSIFRWMFGGAMGELVQGFTVAIGYHFIGKFD